MKFLLLTLVSFPVMADCYLFDLRGEVKNEKGEIHLTVAKGTLSERKYTALRKNEFKFGPFLNKFVSGSFILGDVNPLSGSKLLSVDKLEPAVPDPLLPQGDFIKVKKVPCPK